MNITLPKSLSDWAAIGFGFTVLAVIVVDVSTASAPRTPLESGLMNALQFLLSFGFAWITARLVTKREFQDQQKAFAVAAYRRIHEIDRSLDRLVGRVTNQMRVVSPETVHELEVILAIATGMRETTSSSIADWGDIIGEELVTLKTIAIIKDKQVSILEDPTQLEKPSVDHLGKRADPRYDELEKVRVELKKKLERLPYSLRLLSDDDVPALPKIIEDLNRDYHRDGQIELSGFWDNTFDRKIDELEIGEHLILTTGDVASRINIFILTDASGNAVGMITNRFLCRYHNFVEGLCYFFGRSKMEVQLVDKKELNDHNGDTRHYFTVRVLCAPDEEYLERSAV